MNPLLLGVLAVVFVAAYMAWSHRRLLQIYPVLAYRAYFALKRIPGPPCLPLIGCALEFKLNSVDFTFQLEDWARKYLFDHPEKNGLVSAWVGPVPLVFVLMPDHIKTILESNTLITKPPQYDIISDWIGTGLLTSTNEKWYGRRKMLTPTFHFNVLKEYCDVFIRQGEVFVDQMEPFADTGREVDIFPFIKRCALDVICETAMGTEMHTQTGHNAYYVDAVVRISDIIWSFQRFPWLWLKPIWYGSGIGLEFDRLVKMTNDFTRNVIQERRENLEEEHSDEEFEKIANEGDVKKQKLAFLDLMLRMQKQNSLSDEDIREEVDTFMFEAMGFTIWFLGQYPQYQKILHEEMDSIFGDSDRAPDEADLRKCVYLERCVKEGLRLMPSVPLLARVLSHDVTLDGLTLPENMTVIFSPIITHRDPASWDEPEGFFPDHFLPQKVAARHPYAYIPFSAGPRNCIGQKFAIAEEKAVLSWFFRRYRVESVEPFPGNRCVPEVILKPHAGFNVRIFKRTAGDVV